MAEAGPSSTATYCVIPGRQAGSKTVVIEGYHYCKDKNHRVKCSKSKGGKDSLKCLAKAHLDKDYSDLSVGSTGECTIVKAHTCGEGKGDRETYQRLLKKNCIDRCLAELTLSPQHIYDQERIKFLEAYKDDPKIDLIRDALSDIRKADLFKSMWVRRRAKIPKVPKSARESLDVSNIIYNSLSLFYFYF